MSTAPLPRIFVSHSHKDHEFSLRLVEDLRRILDDEEAVWYDAQGGLHGGDSWWRKIMQEIKARPVFIVILSPDAMTSQWVQNEIDLAWKQKHSPIGKRIIPLLYRQCEVRDDLDILHHINFLSPTPYEQGFQDLLLALGLSSQKQPQSNQPKKSYEQSFQDLLLGLGRSSQKQPQSNQSKKSKEQWLEEGNARYNLKQYELGIADYDRAISFDPNFAKAYYNRGLAHQALKHDEQAQADRARAIALDPSFQWYSYTNW